MSFSGDTEDESIPAMTSEPVSANASSPGRSRRPSADLDNYKVLITKLFAEDNLPIIDITRQLNLEYGLDVDHHIVSRRITAWSITRKYPRVSADQQLHDRILFHYNKNLDDEQILKELQAEGYEIGGRTLHRLGQKLGMKRRSRYPEYRENPEEKERIEASAHSEVESEERIRFPMLQNPKEKSAAAFNTALISKVTSFVQNYMGNYDASHDFNHIKRVVGLAHLIYQKIKEESQSQAAELDLHVVTLAALLHDVGDKKYLQPGQDANTLVLEILLNFGTPEDLAIKVQRIVVGVSYSSEIRDPAQLQALILKYPELSIVQDADRLDAIGAIGIGRTFTFGGARGERDMGETIQHFEDKLERLESMMKTMPGKSLARERTEKLSIFKRWWQEEEEQSRGYCATPENPGVQ